MSDGAVDIYAMRALFAEHVVTSEQIEFLKAVEAPSDVISMAVVLHKLPAVFDELEELRARMAKFR